MKQDFGKVAEDFTPFTFVLGKMLREFDEISGEDYDFVGQLQARTILVAEAFENGEQREKILEKFGGRDFKNNNAPTGKLDINSAIFGLKRETAIADLNTFLESIGIEKMEEKMDAAIQAVHAEKGVNEKAAASAVILKALCMPGYDRDAKQAIVDASLIMQLGTRALKRIKAFENGEYNRQEALDLQNLSNKLNYKFDPLPLVNVNEALLFICATEMRIDTQLKNVPDMDIHELQKRYELALKAETQAIIEAMPAAAALYRKAGKEELALKAEKAYAYYSEQYADILSTPHIMKAPEGPEQSQG